MNIVFPEKLLPRDILSKIIPLLEEENIILLTGARQTGKTYLLYLLMKELLNKGIPLFQIIYFDLENVYDFTLLQKLKDFNDFLKILKDKGADTKKRVFIFMDEIQHLKNPSSFLKYLHDHYKPKLKFIVSGSSSLEIKKKFTDRLTGRVYGFVVRTLKFSEFLEFKNEMELLKIVSSFDFRLWVSSKNPEAEFKKINPRDKERLDDLLKEYLILGGYPAVTLKENILIKQKDLQEIYSLYVRRDIKDIGKIEDISGYNNLVSLLCFQIGNLIKDQELALSSGLSRPTVKKYLFLLENTYVLKLLLPFFSNKRLEITKTPKVYFEDMGLRNAVINNFNLLLDQRQDAGMLLENFVFNQLSKEDEFLLNLRFWRSQSKNEVDFICQRRLNEVYPLEVKLNFPAKKVLPSGLKSFINLYRPSRGFIVHLGEFSCLDYQKIKICLIPAWAI